MLPHDIKRLIREHGLPPNEAEDIAAAITRKANVRAKVNAAKDWERLLAPLKKDIKQRATTVFKYKTDPVRERGEFNLQYLNLQRKTRDTIEIEAKLNTRGMPVGEQKTIPEVARERNLSGDGMRWSDWVPPRVRNAFLLAHANMKLAGIDIRTTPFLTRMERTAQDTRWDKLAVYLTRQINLRTDPTDPDVTDAVLVSQAPLINALKEALRIVNRRPVGIDAPVKWIHVLPKDQQAALHEWHTTTRAGQVESLTWRDVNTQ